MTASGGRGGQVMAATPFERLTEQYDDRMMAARSHVDRGGGAVGVVGNVAPVELILAAGKLPVLIGPALPRPTPLADPWMEPDFDWEQRSVVDRALGGEFALLDLLVVTRSYHHVYYYLKEIVRQGQGADVPPLQMYDLMQSQREAVRPYGLGRTADLRDRLARLAGCPIGDDDLQQAIRLTNGRRQAIRRLLERRRAGQVSGAQAIRAIGAGHLMHPTTYADTLDQFLADLAPDPTLAGKPRLLVVPAEPLYHPALHDVLEQAGGLVVAEDDWWGSRAAGRDIPEDGPLLEAIFEKYFSDAPTLAVSPRAPREAWLREQVEQSDVDAVVFYVPPSDQLFGWYYPGLKAYLDGRGMPSILLRQDALEETGRAGITVAMAEFLGGLKSTGAAAEGGAR